MSNETTFICGACEKEVDHDASKGHVPPGWRMIRVFGEVDNYCEECGLHFDNKTPGGDNQIENISPAMQDMLGLDEDEEE
ncbi:MAG: hypothetical protein KKC99_01850 [Proteobacteria bacterium]|nr:hypothetical protein [Pseudomonadota bacterium]